MYTKDKTYYICKNIYLKKKQQKESIQINQSWRVLKKIEQV